MRFTLEALLAAALALLPAAARADLWTYDWDFGSLLSGSSSAPTGTFAHLTAVTTDHQYFSFDLKVNDAASLASMGFPTGTFFTALSVNDDRVGSAADPATVAMDSSTSVVSQVGLKANASGPGGTKVWDFDFTIGTNCNSTATCRLSAGEEVRWHTIFNTAIEFNVPAFAIHVQGLTSQQGSSAWYASTNPQVVHQIPEPETYAMLLAGLALMGFVARRRAAA